MRRVTRFNLFVAFAFTVMADPVSSVAYAMEASMDGLDGDLTHLVTTMSLVVAIIAVVAVTYHQLIRRFPKGGGGAEALAHAFGEGWAFVPVGALLVDFTLTIAVSCSAGASALIAYVPELADLRTPMAVALVGLVGLVMLTGHRGRVVFATATLAFIAVAAVVILRGTQVGRQVAPTSAGTGDGSLLPILFAVPLGMALATGVEAPSNAVAQLGGMDTARRRRFGQATLWLMVAIVGTLTICLAALADRMGTGLPQPDSTMLADIARAATGGDWWFGAFQITSLALLLAAAASAYMAGSGLLKALARHGERGLVPHALGNVNRFAAPPRGIAVLAIVTCVIVIAGDGRDQQIVQYYAVAVFASFLGATIAAAVLAFRDRQMLAFGVDVVGALLVTAVLALNLLRGGPLVSLAAALIASAALYGTWVHRGRPSGLTTLVH